MGLGYSRGGRAAGQRDKIVIKPFVYKLIAKATAWAQENRERAREIGRESRNRNRQNAIERSRRYYNENIGKCRTKSF